MNGYLMQEQSIVRGQDCFIESFNPENSYGVVFEDDGDTAYFYAVEKDKEGNGLSILDALHIYETGEEEAENAGEGANQDLEEKASSLIIIWSKDWMKCALVINGSCHAIFDFAAHGGYNINEFPPPNDIWTKGERKLTDEIIRQLF